MSKKDKRLVIEIHSSKNCIEDKVRTRLLSIQSIMPIPTTLHGFDFVPRTFNSRHSGELPPRLLLEAHS